MAAHSNSQHDEEARQGFNFNWHMRRLCDDLAQRLPQLAHVDMSRVAIRFCQARKPVRHGLHASLTPLRFAGGSRDERRGRFTWTIQPLFDVAGREMLYLLSFYLPRFLDRPLGEKLDTVVHELWHISEAFDGDLRRHPGRCYAHSPSQRDYDAQMSRLAEQWLSRSPPTEVYDFLRFDFAGLQRRHGRVFGQRIATPKLLRTRAQIT